MIIAEKLLSLRKKNGFSQEELAEKLGVSRQSISKWEGAISVPDINKILEMSKMFGVSTDYLLKDDIEFPEYIDVLEQNQPRRISAGAADEYISACKRYGKQTAIGAALCILSPVLLLLLNAAAEEKTILLSEDTAIGIGFAVTLLIVACAVCFFILRNQRFLPHASFKEHDFELEYGVCGILKERQTAQGPARLKSVIISVSLFFLSTVPLILASLLSFSELTQACALVLLLILVALGVYLLLPLQKEKECYELLLTDGERGRKKRVRDKKYARIESIFWPAITAVYLLWSFLTEEWRITWIVWPVAALAISSVFAWMEKE